MSKKELFNLKVREDIEFCERLIDNAINARQGTASRNEDEQLLNNKLKILQACLPKINDKTLYNRCKNIIEFGKK